jgi:hypothetical protein
MKVNTTDPIASVPSGGEQHEAFPANSEPRLRVTVLYTTPAGTVAALVSAGDLARQLGAQITLIATKVVPFLLPLDHPHVAIDFLTKHCRDLVAEADVMDEQVTIRIWLCRDREDCLMQALLPHSLIVIGGGSRWWQRSERGLASRLQRLGHRVVFVDAPAQPASAKESSRFSRSAFFRGHGREAGGFGK